MFFESRQSLKWMLPRRPMTDPRRVQDRHHDGQRRLSRAQDGLSIALRSFQDGPRRPPDGSRRLQDGSKTPPRQPKRLPRRPKRPPTRRKEEPKKSPKSISDLRFGFGTVWGRFGVDLEPIWSRCWVDFRTFGDGLGKRFDRLQVCFRSLLGCMFALLLVPCAFGDEPKG